jgi:hypothetical protein
VFSLSVASTVVQAVTPSAAATQVATANSESFTLLPFAVGVILILLFITVFYGLNRILSAPRQSGHAVLLAPPARHPESLSRAQMPGSRQLVRLQTPVRDSPTQPRVTVVKESPQPRMVVYGRANDPDLLCRFCGLELGKFDHAPCRKGRFDE